MITTIVAVLIAIGAILTAAYVVANSRGKLNHLRQECQALRSRLEQLGTRRHGDNHEKKNPPVHPSTPRQASSLAEARQQDKLDSGSEADKLRQEVQALTHQLQLAKEETQKQIEQELQQRLQEQKSVVNRLSKEVESYKEKQKRREAQERASREALPPELQQLPETLLPQVARVYRKAEQNEQLLALGRGKLQLAQERLGELQKRYFSVCRELALATKPSDQKGNADNSERQANGTSNGPELSQQKKQQQPSSKKTQGAETASSEVATTTAAAAQTEEESISKGSDEVSATSTDGKKSTDKNPSGLNAPKGATATPAENKAN
ncbi:MAG: hypothetical protein AAF471_01275 [Myxococcota bacterium]